MILLEGDQDTSKKIIMVFFGRVPLLPMVSCPTSAEEDHSDITWTPSGSRIEKGSFQPLNHLAPLARSQGANGVRHLRMSQRVAIANYLKMKAD
jgi:hypothetical protein